MAKGQIKQKGGRDTQFKITVTPEEKALIVAGASKAGLSQADYIVGLVGERAEILEAVSDWIKSEEMDVRNYGYQYGVDFSSLKKFIESKQNAEKEQP